MVVHPLKDFAKIPFNEVVELLHGDLHLGLGLERSKMLLQQFGPNKFDMEEKVNVKALLSSFLLILISILSTLSLGTHCAALSGKV